MKTFYLFFLIQIITSKRSKILITDEGTEEVDSSEYCLARYENNCLICVDSLIIDQECEPLKTKIKHCINYDSETKCENCQYNFKLSQNQESCEKIEQQDCIGEDENGNDIYYVVEVPVVD
mgnify:CR=1 FL=1